MKKQKNNDDFYADVAVADSSKLIKKVKKVKTHVKEKGILAVAGSKDLDAGVVKVSKLLKKKTGKALGKEKAIPAAVESNDVAVKKAKKINLENGKKSGTSHPKKKNKNATAENPEDDMGQTKQLPVAAKKKKKTQSMKTKALPVDADVQTSESETEDEADASQGEVKGEEEPKKIDRGKEYTLFVGNLPPTKSASHIRTMFKKYGTILTIRFRTNTGSKLLKRNEMKKAQALNCYIRYAEKENVQKACEMDGHMIDGNRIRVSPQDVKQLGCVKSTIFVGNLRNGTKDSELYDFFSSVGEIEYVRQIANRNVAYVCFKKGVSIKKALKMNQQMLNNRPLRVMPVDPTKSNLKKNKKGHLVKRNRLPPDGAGKKESDGGKKTANDFHGNVVNEGGSKKKKRTLKPGQKAKKIISMKLKAAMSIKQ
uniref:RRM domain-containing protein n=1 Tax=Anopheles atroparvus TaxID=41427 RepID=A0A182IMQ4_ANOAO